MNCTKKPFATKAAAMIAVVQMARRGCGSDHRGQAPTAYRCPSCHQWHAGYVTRKDASAVKNKRPRFEPVCDWSAAL